MKDSKWSLFIFIGLQISMIHALIALSVIFIKWEYNVWAVVAFNLATPAFLALYYYLLYKHKPNSLAAQAVRQMRGEPD